VYATYDVDYTNYLPLLDIDIACIAVLRKHKSSLSFKKEINALDVFALRINVLIFIKLTRLENWTYP
jgi:hypothetical protein